MKPFDWLLIGGVVILAIGGAAYASSDAADSSSDNSGDASGGDGIDYGTTAGTLDVTDTLPFVDPTSSPDQSGDQFAQLVTGSMNSSIQFSPEVESQIDDAAARYGVDPNLAKAVAWQESRGKQSAVSSVGALGIFQLMPSTAAGLGVDPTIQSQNIDGGVKYLSQLLTKYNGDTTLALAAYNAGPGNVAKYGGVPPFSETQAYIAAILGFML